MTEIKERGELTQAAKDAIAAAGVAAQTPHQHPQMQSLATAPQNPLAKYTTEELHKELKSRGL